MESNKPLSLKLKFIRVRQTDWILALKSFIFKSHTFSEGSPDTKGWWQEWMALKQVLFSLRTVIKDEELEEWKYS